MAFCLAHMAEYEALMHRRHALYARELERIDDEMHAVAGLPRPPKRPIHYVSHMGDINSVNVVGSHGATVNIRSRVEQVNTVTVGVADSDLRDALERLALALESTPVLGETQKDEALQLASALAEESAKPEKRGAVLKGLLAGLRDILSASSDLLVLLKAVAAASGFTLS